MHLTKFNQPASHATNISYSQLSLAQARSQRKLKAIFVLCSIVFLASIFILNLVSNSTNLSATNSGNLENNNSAVNQIAKLASASSNKAKDSAENNSNSALSSTNTDPNTAKNCTPTNSYLKPASPTVNRLSNQVISAATITSSYTVYGNSPEQITNQIFSCTPVLSGGKRFAASTDYSISWSAVYKTLPGNPGMCRVSSAGVGLNQTIVLPNWIDTGGASAQTKQQWNSFITNLRLHEAGHAAINTQYANQILNELRSMPATSCSAIDSKVNAKANSLINSMNRTNSNLDNHTNHGATTGARF